MKKENLVGQKFGKLIVKEMLYNYNNTKRTKCLCDCDCGNTNIIRGSYQLKHSKDSSCGCGKQEYIIKYRGRNINGEKFGKLLILDTLWEKNKVKCLCDCGSEVILSKHEVQSGHTKSCGCLKQEILTKINNVNHTNDVSDYGIRIIEKAHKNKYNQTLWKCKCFCGNIFYELPARILNGHVRSCGCLNQSSRGLLIENILKENNIIYKTEYTFEDCKGDKNYVLRFDFAILDQNNQVKYLLEYDGIQHFEPVEYFGGQETYKDTIKRDEIKNQYCKNHNIPLYRLNYKMSEKELKDKIINIIYP